MKFRFICNACGIFIGSKGTTLLMDPWLDDGVFEGSWCNFPQIKTKHSDLQHVDIIYLSHIHPDHYDDRFFNYRKDIPILILDDKYNFLDKKLTSKGYTNILKLKDKNEFKFREFSLTLFEPFAKHTFHESVLGNLIDSALLVKDIDGTTAFNANDNTPSINACRKLKDNFGTFDLVMINYNAAGPYPSCFQNLSNQEKKKEHKNVLNRNINHLIECCNVLKPNSILPFAGAYVLGGKEWRKNEFLGTTTWDECRKAIEMRSNHNVITMQENNILNINNLQLEFPYIPINVTEMQEYISQTLSKIIYPYEQDPPVSDHELESLLSKSIEKFREKINRFNIKIKSTITLVLGEERYLINKGDSEYKTRLDFSLDKRLLLRILKRQSQWNSAEIGCHIDTYRTPNNYEVDAHTMMQFLHI